MKQNKITEEILNLLRDGAECLDDCLMRIYPDEFSQDNINDSAKRWSSQGGTIARIAKLSDKMKEIVKENE